MRGRPFRNKAPLRTTAAAKKLLLLLVILLSFCLWQNRHFQRSRLCLCPCAMPTAADEATQRPRHQASWLARHLLKLRTALNFCAGRILPSVKSSRSPEGQTERVRRKAKQGVREGFGFLSREQRQAAGNVVYRTYDAKEKRKWKRRERSYSKCRLRIRNNFSGALDLSFAPQTPESLNFVPLRAPLPPPVLFHPTPHSLATSPTVPSTCSVHSPSAHLSVRRTMLALEKILLLCSCSISTIHRASLACTAIERRNHMAVSGPFLGRDAEKQGLNRRTEIWGGQREMVWLRRSASISRANHSLKKTKWAES